MVALMKTQKNFANSQIIRNFAWNSMLGVLEGLFPYKTSIIVKLKLFFNYH